MTFGVLLEVAYLGTHFHGWASQVGTRTVAGVLLDAVHTMQPHVSELRGASRTDAGVHAKGQLVAFDANIHIPPRGWVLGLNRGLPGDVAVRAAFSVPATLTPRLCTLGKRYVYQISFDPRRCPFQETTYWRLNSPLDIQGMRLAASTLVGTHDFRAFRSSEDKRKDTVRTIWNVTIDTSPELDTCTVVVEGDRFMHNMVRIMVGTLVDIGRARLPMDCLARALASGSRRDLGTTAPAHGLFLDQVWLKDVYPTQSWPPGVRQPSDGPYRAGASDRGTVATGCAVGCDATGPNECSGPGNTP